MAGEFYWLYYSMWLFHLHRAVENTAFFPVFPLAGSAAKASFRLSLWNFKEKTSTIFYNTAILLVTPLEFRESASHFLMARPSKTSGKRMIPLRAITQRLRYSRWLFHLHGALKIQPFYSVFPLAGSTAKTFFRLSLWNFKEKTSIFFYNTAILLVTPLEFRESASHFLGTAFKNIRKAGAPAAGHNAKIPQPGPRDLCTGCRFRDYSPGKEAAPVHTISRLLSTPCRE